MNELSRAGAKVFPKSLISSEEESLLKKTNNPKALSKEKHDDKINRSCPNFPINQKLSNRSETSKKVTQVAKQGSILQSETVTMPTLTDISDKKEFFFQPLRNETDQISKTSQLVTQSMTSNSSTKKWSFLKEDVDSNNNNSVSQKEKSFENLFPMFFSAEKPILTNKIRNQLTKIFFDLSQSVQSTYNQEIIKDIAPGSVNLFKKISELRKVKMQLEYDDNSNNNSLRPVEVKISRTFRTSSMSQASCNQDPPPKICNIEYEILRSEYEILELYKLALEGLCENKHPMKLKKGSLFKKMFHTKNDDESLSKILPSLVSTYIQELEKIISNHRLRLIKNIQEREYVISSYTEIEAKLKSNLFETAMETLEDIERAIKNRTIHILINDIEVDLYDKSSTECFFLVLENFSKQFFGQSKLFEIFAKEIGYDTKDLVSLVQQKSLSNFNELYSKLMNMDDQEKTRIKTNLERIFKKEIQFDKVLKYFKFAHHIFGQRIVYFFTMILLNMRFAKFEKLKRGLTSPNVPDKINRNETFIKLGDNGCEIKYVRLDGLIDANAILTQEYSFTVDVGKDEVTINKLSLKVCYAEKLVAKKDELREMIMDLNLLMESLNFPSNFKNFPPLEVKCMDKGDLNE